MEKAPGSYPEDQWFKSIICDHMWPRSQAVKTSPFHGGDDSSNLFGVTNDVVMQPITVTSIVKWLRQRSAKSSTLVQLQLELLKGV